MARRLLFLPAPANQSGVMMSLLGTIRYHHDAYNAVTDIDFIDDCERVNRDYQKHFGEQFKLRHALPKSIKDKRVGT